MERYGWFLLDLVDTIVMLLQWLNFGFWWLHSKRHTVWTDTGHTFLTVMSYWVFEVVPYSYYVRYSDPTCYSSEFSNGSVKGFHFVCLYAFNLYLLSSPFRWFFRNSNVVQENKISFPRLFLHMNKDHGIKNYLCVFQFLSGVFLCYFVFLFPIIHHVAHFDQVWLWRKQGPVLEFLKKLSPLFGTLRWFA